MFKYLKAHYKYLTAVKVLNLFVLKYEYKRRKTKLRSRPLTYYIDTGNFCNLRCPLCPTGTFKQKRKKQLMSFEEYKKIFDKVNKYAIEIALYNWGEPFLNKDIFKIIKYTKKNGVGALISSNFNVVNEEKLKQIVESGLDKIIISLDGADQESYQHYRVGGNFDKVFGNVKRLVELKKKYNSSTPEIEWQYLITKKNAHMVPKAKKLAKSINVNIVFNKFQISQEITRKGLAINSRIVDEWIPDSQKANPENYTLILPAPCYFLYHILFVNSDGGVSPCCAINDSKTDFGDIVKSSLSDVWNNENYQSARSIFAQKKKSTSKKSTICHSCSSVK